MEISGCILKANGCFNIKMSAYQYKSVNNYRWASPPTALSLYSVSPIYRGRVYRGRVYRGIGYIAVACWTPFFCPPISRILQTWRPRARYFSRNRGNSLHSIGGRQFFAKSAHRDSLCSCSLETIFREINSSLPVNAGWNTCCAMGSQARRSIDTSIVSQSRVQLIQR